MSARACNGDFVAGLRGVAAAGSGQSKSPSNVDRGRPSDAMIDGTAIRLRTRLVERQIRGDVVLHALVEREAGAPHRLEAQLAGRRQHRIADLLAREPARRKPPEEPAVAVDLGRRLAPGGRLPIRLRQTSPAQAACCRRRGRERRGRSFGDRPESRERCPPSWRRADGSECSAVRGEARSPAQSPGADDSPRTLSEMWSSKQQRHSTHVHGRYLNA